jgi:hypothetical protein
LRPTAWIFASNFAALASVTPDLLDVRLLQGLVGHQDESFSRTTPQVSKGCSFSESWKSRCDSASCGLLLELGLLEAGLLLEGDVDADEGLPDGVGTPSGMASRSFLRDDERNTHKDTETQRRIVPIRYRLFILVFFSMSFSKSSTTRRR